MMADPLANSEPKRHARRRWVRWAVILVLVLIAVVVIVNLATGGGHTPGPPPGGH